MNGSFKLKQETRLSPICSFRQVDGAIHSSKLKIDFLSLNMKQIVLPPPIEVDEDFRFYMFYSATNVVAPIALYMLVRGLGALFHFVFGLTPTFTVYVGMPAFWTEAIVIFALNCWAIVMFPKHRLTVANTLIANVFGTIAAGSSTVYLAIPLLPLAIQTRWDILFK